MEPGGSREDLFQASLSVGSSTEGSTEHAVDDGSILRDSGAAVIVNVAVAQELLASVATNPLDGFTSEAEGKLAPPADDVTIDDGMEALRIGVAATRAQATGATVNGAEIQK